MGNNESIKTGNISGTGIAVGHGAQANVTITQAETDKLLILIEELISEITKAPLNDGVKKVLIQKAVPQMKKNLQEKKSKEGISESIEKVNDVLEAANTSAESVSGIVKKIVSIAKTAGIVIKKVAPFIAALL